MGKVVRTSAAHSFSRYTTGIAWMNVSRRMFEVEGFYAEVSRRSDVRRLVCEGGVLSAEERCSGPG